MEDGFAVQFLAVAWRFILLIVILIGLAIFVVFRNRKRAQEERRAKKENMMRSDATSKKRNSKKQKQRQRQSDAVVLDDEDDLLNLIPAGGSIFEDESFFPDDEGSYDPVALDEGDDSLADLYAAREQAIQADDEEIVDLASLLTNMAKEPKEYHFIDEDPVAVRLVTKRIAVADELLTILRDDRDQRLMVQIGEVAYRTLQGDASARKQFARVMKELSNVILVEDANSPESVKLNGEQPNRMVADLIDVQVSSGGDTQAREMMSVLRDTADGHLIVQIGNTGYRSLVGHDKAKVGFQRVMKDLSASVTTPDDNPPVVPQKTTPKSSTPELLPPFGSPIMSEDGTIDEPLPGDIRLPSMDEMPDAYEVDRFGRIRPKKLKSSEKVQEINIADAIEEYLQYKTSMTPQFQGRGIHISSALGGGVRIEVDGEYYEFVDEVADPEAQAFIKQAVDEWQERH